MRPVSSSRCLRSVQRSSINRISTSISQSAINQSINPSTSRITRNFSQSTDSKSKPTQPITSKSVQSVKQSKKSSPPVSPFVPFGQAPRVPEVLVIPVNHPILPGLTFDLPLSSLHPSTLQSITQQINKRIPYAGLFLIKDEEANNQRPEEAAVTQADAASEQPSNGRVMPHITSVDSIHSIGTLCQFVVSGDRLKGHVHRRIAIRHAAKQSTTQSNNLYVCVEHIDEAEKSKQTAQSVVNVNHDDAADQSVNQSANQSNNQAVNQGLDEHEFAAYAKELAFTMQESAALTNIRQRSAAVQARLIDALVDQAVSASRLADVYASFARCTPAELQSILQSLSPAARLDKVLHLLRAELSDARINSQVFSKIQERLSAANAKHMLKEQKKVIDSMLGVNRNDKEALIKKFTDRLINKDVPDSVRRVIDEEVAKLQTHENESGQEFHLLRNYLDWLTALPWGVSARLSLDLQHAERVLSSAHYGLEDVKTRILEWIAAGKLLGRLGGSGKTICLVGPPGVGKTSIGQSIATACRRSLLRIAVGGMDDATELKGHRRTYVASMPGKLIQQIKRAEVKNPVILLDEIDKLGRGHRGDPAAALLEVLDPEQNATFTDHYLDVPFDLSEVLFICTANSTDTIPPALADRMEFIHLSGYTASEKYEIARRYLEPQSRRKNGVKEDELTLDDAAVNHLIRWYAREAGVRNLGKLIDKIYRKVALKLVRGDFSSLVLTPANLHDYVGAPVYSSDRMYETTPAGVAMGLAWTSHGGSTIFIESSIADPGHPSNNPANSQNNHSDASGGELMTTGQLGDVMKESSSIAYTVAKRFMRTCAPSSGFFQRHRVHLHVPAGSTPKDGPSAGITMASALLSLACDSPMAQQVAMTGELTLTGRVLAIGGVKEKVIAAKHAQVTKIVLPLENKRDWDELADYVKEGIEPHFVNHFEQVLEIAMPNLYQQWIKNGGAMVHSTINQTIDQNNIIQ